MALASSGARDYAWQLTPTPTDATARFRGASAVSEETAWVSGWQGTGAALAGKVLRTTNRGASWQSVGPPGALGLQFRDIEAFDADTAVIMSHRRTLPTRSGSYRTENGGQTWTLTFQNTEPTAFYDCMAFFDKHRGLALSDPINGRFRILATSDGGRSWQIVDADMPPALPGEFAFAASGQCLTAAGGRDAWFGTGGDAVARVFHSSDRGRSWTVANTPIRSLTSGGISALCLPGSASRDRSRQRLCPRRRLGGHACAVRTTVERRWQLNQNTPDGLRSGAHWVTGRDVIIVGEGGSDVSTDQGRTWRQFGRGQLRHGRLRRRVRLLGRGRAGPRRLPDARLALPSMILERGVVRTLEPSLPTASALAIAGERIAGGVGTHEVALPSPDRVDLGGRCVVPGFTDAHVHFPTWAIAQREVRLEGTASIEEALARVRDGLGSVARALAAGPRLARCGVAVAADEGGARRGRGRGAGCDACA